ncbi:hypothetical protein SISSUDRAFT_1117774 [Sistotremastrum suecicum HHB10207 ss-3]|uniref:SH3 domain-containing protein n=1 Tax=Sistotremastrum suecicum HHB10207 ss-3 TaxID=1314776 RepID=A0A166G460_9AGAM|nr:hypothetical protein SISSUDRAFT_1117774 [Sistotremastrum suecicum HHB10207 ss-3]
MPPANASALLAHLTARVRNDIEFLVSEGYISPSDGQLIYSKLPRDGAGAGSYDVNDATKALANTRLKDGPRGPPGSPPRDNNNGKVLWRAKAIWGYNEDNSDPNDLTVRAGQIVEIVEEVNPEWLRGRANGREGLLPATYVEKIQQSHAPPPGPPPASNGPPLSPSGGGPPSYFSDSERNPNIPGGGYPMPKFGGGPPGPYPPPGGPPGPPGGGGRFMAPYPPPGQGGYAPPPLPPPQQNQVGQWGPPPGPPAGYNPGPPQQPPPPAAPQAPADPKKSKLNKYGSIAGQSAAAGVGFGAGSAIGSGIINSIF